MRGPKLEILNPSPSPFLRATPFSHLPSTPPPRFSEKYLELLIQLLQYLAPDGLNIDQLIRQVLEEGKASFESMSKGGNNTSARSRSGQSTPGAVFFFYWQMVMGGLLLAFLLSCISPLAQYYQLTLDSVISKKLRSRLPASVRNDITSPKSGRLVLPPPTPHTKGKKT